jgi:hypothetical protein
MCGIVCIKCLDQAATVRLDLDDANTLTCAGCDETFTTDDVLTFLDAAIGWRKLLPWVTACPVRQAADAGVGAEK